MNAIAKPTGRYTHRADSTIAQIEKLLPTARVLETMPEGEYGIDLPIEYFKLGQDDIDAKMDIRGDCTETLRKNSPIKVGDIVWTEPPIGDPTRVTRALVLSIRSEFHHTLDRYVLRFRCVLQRADGKWGCKQRSIYPGFIQRAYDVILNSPGASGR